MLVKPSSSKLLCFHLASRRYHAGGTCLLSQGFCRFCCITFYSISAGKALWSPLRSSYTSTRQFNAGRRPNERALFDIYVASEFNGCLEDIETVRGTRLTGEVPVWVRRSVGLIGL